jgi:PrtD family type I secretion system ABC transporter
MTQAPNTLRKVLSKCTPFFVYAGVFSFSLNLLALASPLYMLTVFDRVLSSRSNETLVVLTLIFAFFLAIESIIKKLRTRLFARLGDTVFLKLREPVLNAVLSFDQKEAAAVHGLEDLESIKSFLAGSGLRAAFEVPWIPIFLWVLWLFHPALSMIALVSALTMFGLTYLEDVVSKKNQAMASLKGRESQDFIVHALRNAEVVSALSMRDNIRAKWEVVNNEYYDESVKARSKVGGILAFSEFVRGALGMGSIAAAAYLVINVEGVSPGVLMASTIVMGKATAPILTVLGSWRSFVLVRAAYERLDTLLGTAEQQRRGFEPPEPAGRVSVESLLYFISRDKTILNGINFQLAAGEALGIIGTSASGKTTLARLLVGIMRPSDGAVRLDSADVSQWSANGLGQWIGYLPQDQQLFEGTVAENIARMANPHDKVDEVVAAARRVGVHDFMLRLIKGYDTEVGPGGKFLSGGQRQLVALARAVYGNPKLVVLDEPNSYLDGNSEALLLDMIQRLKADGITQIIISHKPSVLADVDKILVLGQSKQLMFGPRDEILQRMNVATGPNIVPMHADKHPGKDVA